MNWRGTPLVNLATIVSLIGSTHGRSGLRVRSEIDRGRYPGGVTLTDAQMATIRLQRHQFHRDWNDTLHPAPKRPGIISGTDCAEERRRVDWTKAVDGRSTPWLTHALSSLRGGCVP
jgi:hypothetical protein